MDVGHDSCHTHTRTIYYLTNILPDKTASSQSRQHNALRVLHLSRHKKLWLVLDRPIVKGVFLCA